MNWKKLLIALGGVAIALLLVLFGGGMMLDGNVHSRVPWRAGSR